MNAQENAPNEDVEKYDGIDITILITCYNEAPFIANSINTAARALVVSGLSYEIVVIDDASTDNSVECIREYMKEHPEVPINLRINAINQGLANNFIDGAFLGRGKYYRLLCGDDAANEDSLVNILRYVGIADMIVPYQNQNQVVGKSPFRRCISKAFSLLANSISGFNIKYYNGMPVLRRYDVMRYPPISYGFGFQADLVTRLMDTGCTYLQVCDWGTVDRKGGGSNAVCMRNVLSVLHTLLEILFRRARRMLYHKHIPKPKEIKLESPENEQRRLI